MKSLIGKKIGMTQVFTAEGKMIAVTAIQAEPNFVVGQRTTEKDGYQANIIATQAVRKINQPQAKQLEKVGAPANLKLVREIKTNATEDLLATGSTIDVSLFQAGDLVDVTGTSKGKGFAGVIKRHNFSRGPETHGSDHHRKPGSIGMMFPQRVVLGKKMPGHMGNIVSTVKKLRVIEVHPEQQIILIKGAIPGPKGSYVKITGERYA
ncbi:MAG: large subunit ribosomal protein L3 [Candidatus Berkelbacteria bacterium Gr01-1014_85]|uniref:Large ribosomal subunit protein uL3 n=1 Tax=Candidatus Berkelbacteria bacterium Gr01-1014_85 TaxID=2017150 RepID=A0A554JD73_9BACT|nr:MAG: large subunit ribosomal protein L3 [Candidatus Berkelbacteria bacterium Gr01-1014_85]